MLPLKRVVLITTSLSLTLPVLCMTTTCCTIWPAATEQQMNKVLKWGCDEQLVRKLLKLLKWGCESTCQHCFAACQHHNQRVQEAYVDMHNILTPWALSAHVGPLKNSTAKQPPATFWRRPSKSGLGLSSMQLDWCRGGARTCYVDTQPAEAGCCGQIPMHYQLQPSEYCSVCRSLANSGCSRVGDIGCACHINHN